MTLRRIALALALAGVAAVVLAAVASANVPLTQVSADPYTNATSQHATELEPDTFADHGTVVATFQVGRFFNGGASDIGVVRSGDGGATWGAPGFLHDTFNSGDASSPYERVSDASVAYDAAHGVWIVSSIPLLPNTSVPTVLFNRSTDDGQTWGPAISMPPPVTNSVDLDKNWTVCDNHPSSPFYGHCYTELDNFADGDLELMSTSTDGGLTWSVPIRPVTSTVDHFIPGLAVDPTTSGSSTKLALTYYFYPNANCGGACRLFVGYISSPDGGAHWGSATQLAGPMGLSQIANTSQGPMVGDYISTSFSGGMATTVFAVGHEPLTAAFDEAMYAPTAPL